MITAEEFLKRDESSVYNEIDIIHAMIEFAKLHVKAALDEARKKALIKNEYSGNVGEYCDQVIDANSILNSYPESNIK